MISLLWTLQVYSQLIPRSFLNQAFFATDLPKLSEQEQRRWQHQLSYLYQGLALKDECSAGKPRSLYATVEQEEQVLRSIYASLQYLGLTLVIEKLRPLSQQQADHLVESFCSPMQTLWSRKRLKKRLQEKETDLIQTFDSAAYFSPTLSKQEGKQSPELEQQRLLWLFRNLCSWGNNLLRPRFLTPLLKNPFIMARVFTEMSGQQSVWSSEKKLTFLEPKAQSLKARCQNLMCRPFDTMKSLEAFLPRAAGSLNLREDLQGLYCSHLRFLERDTYGESEPQVQTWQQDWREEDDALQSALLSSLILAEADPLFFFDRFHLLKVAIEESLQSGWERWFVQQAQKLVSFLPYEEQLSFNRVEPPKLKNRIVIDIDYGEMDKTHQYKTKLSTFFSLKLSQDFYRWAKAEWGMRAVLKPEEQKKILQALRAQLEPQVKKVEERFLLLPWKQGLEDFLAREILQLPQLKNEKQVVIPVELRYGAFALKYLFIQNKLLSYE